MEGGREGGKEGEREVGREGGEMRVGGRVHVRQKEMMSRVIISVL